MATSVNPAVLLTETFDVERMVASAELRRPLIGDVKFALKN